MTAEQLLLLAYITPSLVMCVLAFTPAKNILIGIIGLLLTIVIGVILTIQHGPVHAHIPLPRYLPLVIIAFLSGVSLAIIVILRRYIRGFFHEN